MMLFPLRAGYVPRELQQGGRWRKIRQNDGEDAKMMWAQNKFTIICTKLNDITV
jgi:hypothetical protein